MRSVTRQKFSTTTSLPTLHTFFLVGGPDSISWFCIFHCYKWPENQTVHVDRSCNFISTQIKEVTLGEFEKRVINTKVTADSKWYRFQRGKPCKWRERERERSVTLHTHMTFMIPTLMHTLSIININ